ncbi:MAG TPA: hypothetical protein VF221_09840 [Chloroflexota bacterium]
MNGSDNVETGTTRESPEGPADQADIGTGSIPGAVQMDPEGMDTGPTGSSTATMESPRPFTARRPSGMWGYEVPEPVQNALAPLERVGKQYIAWIGCIVLFIGLFVPAKTYSFSSAIVSVSTSQSLWDYGTFWAVILLLLIIASAGLAYLRDYKWLVVTGGASLVILLLNFLYAFAGVAGFSAHPSWGWILLFPGALLIIAAGAMRATERDAVDDNGLNNIIAAVQNKSATR